MRDLGTPRGQILPSLPDREWCACMAPVRLGTGVKDVLDECREMLREPSLDELSDICFGIGRLLGTLTGSHYRRFPGTRRHIDKIDKRMGEHGCVRSARHLAAGRCPSL